MPVKTRDDVLTGIFRVLTTEPKSVNRIAIESGMSWAATKRALNTLKTLGLVDSTPNGRYYLRYPCDQILAATLSDVDAILHTIDHTLDHEPTVERLKILINYVRAWLVLKRGMLYRAIMSPRKPPEARRLPRGSGWEGRHVAPAAGKGAPSGGRRGRDVGGGVKNEHKG